MYSVNVSLNIFQKFLLGFFEKGFRLYKKIPIYHQLNNSLRDFNTF